MWWNNHICGRKCKGRHHQGATELVST